MYIYVSRISKIDIVKIFIVSFIVMQIFYIKLVQPLKKYFK